MKVFPSFEGTFFIKKYSKKPNLIKTLKTAGKLPLIKITEIPPAVMKSINLFFIF